MYATQAREFIIKLIKLQKGMKRKGFVRHDYGAVSQSIDELERYLKAYRYETDEKMRGFWLRKENHIRNLLPGQDYPGFKTIMQEFIELKDRL